MTAALLAAATALFRASPACAQDNGSIQDAIRRNTGQFEYKKPKPSDRFSFNVNNISLLELVKIIGNLTGKSFILGGKVPNIRATIYSPGEVTVPQIFQAFLSVLRLNGLTVVKSGRYYKIVKTKSPHSLTVPILTGSAKGDGDRLVTQIVSPKHSNVEEMAELLGRFKSPTGDIYTDANTGTIIITDYESSLQRLNKIAGLFDKPRRDAHMWFEEVNYIDAGELAELIKEVLSVDENKTKKTKKSSRKKKRKKRRKKRKRSTAASTIGQPESKFGISEILVDERTNSLIIIASKNGYIRVLELVSALDVELARTGSVHIHKLKYAAADEIAKVLSQLSKGSKRKSKKKKGKANASAANLFEGEVSITPDKNTNSLLVASSPSDYLRVRQAIEKLDVPPRQVFIEAVIMEVSMEKNRDIGLGFHSAQTVETEGDQSLVYGSSQPSENLSSLLLSPGMMSGLAVGVRGPDLEGTEDLLGAGVSIPKFGIALQLLQTNSDANVLSTPHILATDNMESSITVGENIPLQQGYNNSSALLSQLAGQQQQSSQSSALTSAIGALGGGFGGYGGFGGFSINRQNVGLTLNITPHVSYDDQVRLEISVEISEVKSADSSLGPNISKKDAQTTSIVADQQTVVIGGLVTDNDVSTTKKVPFFGDIPIIGFLFRQKSTITKKRNLLVFLTPYIVRNSEDFKEIFKRKMAERRAFIERYTAFEARRVDPHVDWSRTNGVIAEMNLILRSALKEMELRRQAEEDKNVDHTPKAPVEILGETNRAEFSTHEE